MHPIRHERSDHDGVFIMEHAGRQIGELHYRLTGGRAIVTHTEIAPDMRERGLGQLLVDAIAQWARAEELKIVPLCSYAKAVLDRTPAHADVLAG